MVLIVQIDGSGATPGSLGSGMAMSNIERHAINKNKLVSQNNPASLEEVTCGLPVARVPVVLYTFSLWLVSGSRDHAGATWNSEERIVVSFRVKNDRGRVDRDSRRLRRATYLRYVSHYFFATIQVVGSGKSVVRTVRVLRAACCTNHRN